MEGFKLDRAVAGPALVVRYLLIVLGRGLRTCLRSLKGERFQRDTYQRREVTPAVSPASSSRLSGRCWNRLARKPNPGPEPLRPVLRRAIRVEKRVPMADAAHGLPELEQHLRPFSQVEHQARRRPQPARGGVKNQVGAV
jgi:hypothetical protein